MKWLKKNKKNIVVISDIIFFLGIFYAFIGFGPIIYDNSIYYLLKIFNKNYQLSTDTKKDSSDNNNPLSLFGKYILSDNLIIEPSNKSFSLVIEKLGLSVPIVPNVSVSNQDKYMKSLQNGVAHAITSDFPSESLGNTYLFAHSGFDLRLLGRYSRSFNLIDKLKKGDLINVIYDNKNFEYKVISNEIVKGWDTNPLNKLVMNPTLTLQSCYPPGTTLNRIVVTAVLVSATKLPN